MKMKRANEALFSLGVIYFFKNRFWRVFGAEQSQENQGRPLTLVGI